VRDAVGAGSCDGCAEAVGWQESCARSVGCVVGRDFDVVSGGLDRDHSARRSDVGRMPTRGPAVCSMARPWGPGAETSVFGGSHAGTSAWKVVVTIPCGPSVVEVSHASPATAAAARVTVDRPSPPPRPGGRAAPAGGAAAVGAPTAWFAALLLRRSPASPTGAANDVADEPNPPPPN